MNIYLINEDHKYLPDDFDCSIHSEINYLLLPPLLDFHWLSLLFSSQHKKQ
jgi:hypothetical protein